MQIIIITGISGSGKSVALNALEDAGYFCVDNLPPVLLSRLVETRLEDNEDKLAVAVDSRSAASLTDLPKSVIELKNQGHAVHVLFLTANDHSADYPFFGNKAAAIPCPIVCKRHQLIR